MVNLINTYDELPLTIYFILRLLRIPEYSQIIYMIIKACRNSHWGSNEKISRVYEFVPSLARKRSHSFLFMSYKMQKNPEYLPYISIMEVRKGGEGIPMSFIFVCAANMCVYYHLHYSVLLLYTIFTTIFYYK